MCIRDRNITCQETVEIVSGVTDTVVGNTALWEDTLVDVLDSVVNIFLCCANTAHHISIVTHILTLNFDL